MQRDGGKISRAYSGRSKEIFCIEYGKTPFAVCRMALARGVLVLGIYMSNT